MCGCQRNAQRIFDVSATIGEHHHDALGLAVFGQILGVAGEGNTGLVDDAFVYRRGDHSAEDVVFQAVQCDVQGIEHIGGVGNVQLAQIHRRKQRAMPHHQRLLALIGDHVIQTLDFGRGYQMHAQIEAPRNLA